MFDRVWQKLKRKVTLEIDDDAIQSGEAYGLSPDCTVMRIEVSVQHHTEEEEDEEEVSSSSSPSPAGARRYDRAKADRLAELLEKMSEVVQHQLMKSEHVLLSEAKQKTEKEGGGGKGRGRRRKVV